MLKLLIPTDGSEAAERAARHAIVMRPHVCEMEVHLLNVQAPMDAWEVRRFLSDAEIETMQRERAEDALRPVRQLLEAAGIDTVSHVAIGEVAEAIAEHAKNLGCHQIIMGCRGMGSLGGLLLGSVSTQVLHLVEIPVTLVK